MQFLTVTRRLSRLTTALKTLAACINYSGNKSLTSVFIKHVQKISSTCYTTTVTRYKTLAAHPLQPTRGYKNITETLIQIDKPNASLRVALRRCVSFSHDTTLPYVHVMTARGVMSRQLHRLQLHGVESFLRI